MTAALHITVGIPASGKSRFAQQELEEGHVDLVLSTDQIRLELTGDMTSMERNVDVFLLLHERINDNLRAGKQVLVDATNLNPVYRRTLRAFATFHNAEAWAYIFADSWNYDLCQYRNMGRSRVVPTDVMRRMHADFTVHGRLAVLHSEGWYLEIISYISMSRGGVIFRHDPA